MTATTASVFAVPPEQHPERVLRAERSVWSSEILMRSTPEGSFWILGGVQPFALLRMLREGMSPPQIACMKIHRDFWVETENEYNYRYSSTQSVYKYVQLYPFSLDSALIFVYNIVNS